MADHYAKTLELLDELDDLERELLTEYRSAARPAVIGDLHGRIGRCLKRAAIHVEAGKLGALEDLHALLDDRLPLVEPVRVEL